MTSTPEGTTRLNRGDDGKMFAPSADRNKDAILSVITNVVKSTARVLEIASGTGQHTSHFAHHLKDMTFQPSDLDPERCASIRAYCVDLTNVADPIVLDAGRSGWSQDLCNFDAIVIVNLFHLIPESTVKTILHEAANALSAGGILIVYGPFMRGGDLTSDGDIAFHNALVSENPDIGYKDDFDVIDWIQENWLEMRHILEMPANNMCLVAQKPTF
jgi:SAM-dependent methyltransferase